MKKLMADRVQWWYGLALVLITLSASGVVHSLPATGSLLPIPADIERTQGHFELKRDYRITIYGRELERVARGARRFSEQLGLMLETSLQLSELGTAMARPLEALAADIEITVTGVTGRYPSINTDESYQLNISSEAIRISSTSGYGALHALQTLLQLARVEQGGIRWPAVNIRDAPRFKWRGLLQDVVRHWMPAAVIKRQLDAMSAAKMNVLHLHLSDDESFRVESLRFPLLNSLGSDGDYFRQDEIAELVEYAADRAIRLVPEFDLPGHSRSWQIAYPQLSSRVGKAYHLYKKDQLFSDPLDPTKEKNIQFIKTLIGEMSALFPDLYFHMGGDEVNYDAWLKNDEILAFMRANGLEKPQDLQAYFIRRYYDILTDLGKVAIGWEEILHKTMPEDAVLHIWLKQRFPGESARHPLLVSGGYYLDLMHTAYAHYQRDPLDVVIDGLNAEQRNTVEKNFLGGEAASWSEHINAHTVDMRNWPRAAAIAERFWSPRAVSDAMGEDNLYTRLFAFSDQLEKLGLRHRSHPVKAMVSLAGNGGNADALMVLASVAEPASEHINNEYGRLFAHITGLTWFTEFAEESYPVARFLEHIPPESEVAWRFNRQIERLIAKQLGDQEIQALKQQLTTWSLNHQKLEETFSRSTLLKNDNVELLSELMSALAGFGLQAVTAIENNKLLSQRVLSSGREVIEKCAYLDHSLEIEEEYVIKSLFRPRGLRMHVLPIQRGIQQLYLAVELI
ncbi:family 20 glycosylhydrolase [uncultured Microbulbifer sp.]|uniref:beta-N-acetylhexosaminidase n=1 Tax=uncultured Microbulbifer sp. TaxID=348147 RepID=UPI002636CC01|nr:family 20 glycosylhydrolase [uncultured Microbulbifer sp.]